MKSQKISTRTLLSTLWIFALFNYLYCDIVGLMDPELLKGFMVGTVGGIHITQKFLLGGSVLMEIPIAMILVSYTAKHSMSRWANVIAGTIMTIVQISTLFFGASPTSYYWFFSLIEISTTAFIVWTAWKWSRVET